MSLVNPVVKALSLLSLVAWASSAAAQGFSVLNPLAPSYTLLGFVYEPPKVEGWRQVDGGPEYVRLIYSEQAGQDAINTRADLTLHAFRIDDPASVPDAATLTRLSMAQRIEEKKQEKEQYKEAGPELLAMAQPQQVTSELPIHEYTLVLKVGPEELVEHHFVVLAPDKSQYLAAKMVTQDKDFRNLPYFKPVLDSIAGLKFAGAEKATNE